MRDIHNEEETNIFPSLAFNLPPDQTSTFADLFVMVGRLAADTGNQSFSNTVRAVLHFQKKKKSSTIPV